MPSHFEAIVSSAYKFPSMNIWNINWHVWSLQTCHWSELGVYKHSDTIPAKEYLYFPKECFHQNNTEAQCHHQMVMLCFSDGMMQGLGFLLLLPVGKELNMLVAHASSGLPCPQVLRAVLTSVGVIWLALPLCMHFIKTATQ